MIERGIDGSEPIRPERISSVADVGERRVATGTWILGAGTLACPECDAPVSPGERPLGPAEPLQCPVCAHGAHVRDFLTLGPPVRPARVVVRLTRRRVALEAG